MKIFSVIIVFTALLHSQSIYEPVNSNVYDFLEKLSIKGILSFDYEIKPLTRIEIAEKIIEAEKHTIQMTALEKELLSFYIKDFKHEINLINNDFDSEIKS